MARISDQQLQVLINHLCTKHRIALLFPMTNASDTDDSDELILAGNLHLDGDLARRSGHSVAIRLVISTDSACALLRFLEWRDNWLSG